MNYPDDDPHLGEWVRAFLGALGELLLLVAFGVAVGVLLGCFLAYLAGYGAQPRP